jgi:UDP-2,3-diacylglucosamine pyrophosphatase LpxH
MASLHCRTAFISDVHLGTSDCKAAYLLDFLRHLRCEKLYLVGDIIDLQALQRRAGWLPEHGAVVAQVLQLLRDGTEVTYIPGNHDAALRPLAGQTIAGVRIALDAVHEGADHRRYRVSHGDEFDPAPDHQGSLFWLGDVLHRVLCWGNRQLHRLRQRRALPYLPLSIIVKSRINKVRAYIHAYEQRAADDARVRGLDGHICGHIHYGQVRQINDVLYLNDGDWVEHCTALVEDQTGVMELIHWSGHATALARSSRERLPPAAATALAPSPLAARQRTRAEWRPAA